ncbi:hypothetical protein D7Y27_14975 [Corallococcus sp. AB004]|uniref:hypothetical protein n=1 Tax=Corallococcus sp. AB038B TaxID=2316718 RepID=UPI000EA25FFB|nr:hypothetical protein [Corallococcus sp. AB038B]RKH99422.1 hypothetical protein D7Y04_20140 [Corallococcus sp. AB038B]RKI43655.1 hypothetical protein D7Y27_14975 [Corallococcus sp. AB004]
MKATEGRGLRDAARFFFAGFAAGADNKENEAPAGAAAAAGLLEAISSTEPAQPFHLCTKRRMEGPVAAHILHRYMVLRSLQQGWPGQQSSEAYR